MTKPLAFTVVLEQFCALRVQANDELHAMKAVTVGPKLIMSAGELMKAANLAKTAPLGRALRSYVKALPDEQLHALLAMIYAGRDKKPDPVAHWQSHIKATVQSRSAGIEVVLEKEHAAEYIRRAIEHLASGIELDTVPARLGISR
jgi:hypothetical protein